MKTNWKDITLKEFEEIHRILSTKAPEWDRVKEIIAYLSGKTVDAIESMPMPIVSMLCKDISFVFTECPKNEIKDHYNIGGRNFIFQKDNGKRAMQAYIDSLALMGDVQNNISQLLATVLLPAVEKNTFFGKKLVPLKYGEVDVFEVSEHLHNNIKAGDATAIMAFFLNHYNLIMLRLIRRMRILVRAQRTKLMFKKIVRPSTYIHGCEVLQELEKNLDALRQSYSKCQ